MLPIYDEDYRPAGQPRHVRREVGRPCLIDAIRAGSLHRVRVALEGGADPCQAFQGSTALMLACEDAGLEMVKALLGAGAKVEDKSLLGWTALCKAAQAGRPDVLSALLAAGADPRARVLDWKSALFLACVGRGPGSLECARILMGQGVDLDAADRFGTTPLMAAAQLGCAEHAMMLVEAGADLSLLDRRGRPASAMARDSWNAGGLPEWLAERERVAKERLAVSAASVVDAPLSEGGARARL